MKKSVLILLTLVPVAVGYLVNHLLLVPGIGMIAFYVLPILTTVFWFWLARQYARTAWHPLASMAIGNAVGILSLAVYLWQFLLESDETRNFFLAVASQMYTAAAPSWIFGRFAILFESQPNTIGRASMVSMEVLAVVYMLLVFVCGYVWERRNLRRDAP